MRDFEEFVRETYDEVVAIAGEDGVKLAEARERVEELTAEAIADGIIESPGLAAAVADCIAAVDTRRRGDLSEAIQFAAAALEDETILGPADPVLSHAFSVGSGVRKALRYCDTDDLDGMVSARRQNMARIVAAFDEFGSSVDLLKATMRTRNARIVRDLFDVAS